MNDDTPPPLAIERLKLLGTSHRFLVLEAVARCPETSVGELAREIGIRQQMLSSTLSRLRLAGLVVAARDRNYVRYSVVPEAFREMADFITANFCRRDQS